MRPGYRYEHNLEQCIRGVLQTAWLAGRLPTILHCIANGVYFTYRARNALALWWIHLAHTWTTPAYGQPASLGGETASHTNTHTHSVPPTDCRRRRGGVQWNLAASIPNTVYIYDHHTQCRTIYYKIVNLNGSCSMFLRFHPSSQCVRRGMSVCGGARETCDWVTWMAILQFGSTNEFTIIARNAIIWHPK